MLYYTSFKTYFLYVLYCEVFVLGNLEACYFEESKEKLLSRKMLALWED